jgi:hypothetical protein
MEYGLGEASEIESESSPRLLSLCFLRLLWLCLRSTFFFTSRFVFGILPTVTTRGCGSLPRLVVQRALRTIENGLVGGSDWGLEADIQGFGP